MTRKLMLLVVLTMSPVIGRASNITLPGNFTADDNVQLFSVSLLTPAAVDFRSYGYAGGTTSTSTTVPGGGFDSILTLFSASGVFIDDNDDGAGVAADPTTGLTGDARITANLAGGNYILALTQYDNFSSGNLADGFVEAGNPIFTADPTFALRGPCPGNMFRDISGTAGRCRSGNWSVDFVNVANVTPVAPAPEPSALVLAGAGLALLFAARRRRPRKVLVLELAVIAVLVSIPAYAQATGPDYSNVSDFLNGKRSVLDVTDIAVFNSRGIPTVVTTSNSSQKIASSFTLSQTFDNSKRARIFPARMFNQAAVSTLTPLYDYNNSALLTFLMQSVANVPNQVLYWQPFGGGDEPDITGGAAADFNSDGFDEMALGFTDGRMVIATANDVNDQSKSVRQQITNLDVLSDMTAGDFKGDGGREIAGLTISNGGLKLVIYAVDPQTLTATTISSLTLTTPGASPGAPITLASIARGRFNGAGHDQLAVGFTTAAGPAYVEVIDFATGTLNPFEASPTLGSPAGNIGFPYGYIQVKTGQFGLPNNQYDQIVYHSSSPQAGGRFFEILTVDSTNFAIGGTAVVTYDQVPCAYGVEVGNFDHRQPDPTTPGQTQPNLNNQVAFLYCTSTTSDSITTGMNIYSVDPASLTLEGVPDSALDLGYSGELNAGDLGSNSAAFVAADLQGRSLTLGEPTVFDVETNIKPSVIIGAPPMHVDFVSPLPGSTAPVVLNLTAAPHTFISTYDFETTDTNKIDDSRKTSWSFGAKEQLSAKYYVGDVDSFGFQVSDSISAAQKIKSSVDDINGSYTAKQSSLSSSSSFDDEVTYKDSGIKIWSYPVIGKMVCPKDKSPCQAGDLVPLTIQFSGPTGAPESEFAAGGSLLWFQPPWEPGNILSYPATLQQLQQMYLEPTTPGSTPVSSLSVVGQADGFFTGGGALKQKTTWSVGTNTETDASFNQNYSFENDLSITDSIGEENVAGSSLNLNLDVNGSYGLSHLNNESTQLGTSSGLEVSVAQAFNSTYQYLVSPYIFGTTVTNAVVDNQPLNNPNSPNPSVQTFGLLRGVFTADPLANGSGRWWAEAYPQPDVALNHPQRWRNTQPGVPSPGDPIPSNCLAGGTGGSSLDCAVLNTRIPDNPWLDEFHQMRGLFVTSANFPGQGPQIMRATAGDTLALTARVYNYSLTAMPAGTQVHVRFYFAPWKGAYAVEGQPSVQISPPNQPAGTDLILGPIPPFSEGAPNWVLATTTFDTSAYDWTKDGDADVVFWVVVWMEDGSGNMVAEMPGHGLTSIPGALTSFADAANLEPIQADKNSYSNNVGFYPQVFAIEAKDSGLTGRPRANVAVNLSKLDVSEHKIAPGGRVDLSGTLVAENGTAASVKVRYYDGNPAKNGRLIAMDLIPRIAQGDPYSIAKSYRPTTCGVHELFAVVNKGKATEVVRRAQPVRVACKAF